MADTSSASKRAVKIKSSNIPQDKSDIIIKHVNEAMDKFTIEKDIATQVKKKCDEVLTGTWHCVVGRNFGCSITHDTKFVMFLQVELLHVLIFKSLE
mmetsp:Transcript_63328/g.111882  ORF Transcript_63328/g.111882 Transcript_63328/m.111882 type:complete len:97 (-) Transcript_63328:109-399(-)|eukprot:CAMPEP_0184980554 /NCGR_PEP_ID=MMETSP1098-20130426/10504_1 /TAXON_ID=89044 /ORGANISM="Spumella elongata, Strain CCAP 955/1" /LENGTH=96 /DNA_ID=CAMNT_0027503999 /DNA_START=132 /DNA_END=422 /DNA_ORIENTATION=-